MTTVQRLRDIAATYRREIDSGSIRAAVALFAEADHAALIEAATALEAVPLLSEGDALAEAYEYANQWGGVALDERAAAYQAALYRHHLIKGSPV